MNCQQIHMPQLKNVKEPEFGVDKIGPSLLDLPDQIGDLKLQNITWDHFKGKVPKNAQYSAHYDFNFNEKKKKYLAKVSVKVLPRSWSILEYRNSQLLMHQYGHYLIGCICALAFQKKVNQLLRQPMTFGVNEWCRCIFNETLNQYLKIQRLYDEQTEHRLSFQNQQKWQNILVKTLQLYDQQNSKTKTKDFKIHKLPKIKSGIKTDQD